MWFQVILLPTIFFTDLMRTAMNENGQMVMQSQQQIQQQTPEHRHPTEMQQEQNTNPAPPAEVVPDGSGVNEVTIPSSTASETNLSPKVSFLYRKDFGKMTS